MSIPSFVATELWLQPHTIYYLCDPLSRTNRIPSSFVIERLSSINTQRQFTRFVTSTILSANGTDHPLTATKSATLLDIFEVLQSNIDENDDAN